MYKALSILSIARRGALFLHVNHFANFEQFIDF